MGIFARNRNTAFYFDSYGEKPVDYLWDYLKSKFPIVNYNKIQLQKIFSSTCGIYVILFIYFSSLGLTPYEIIKLFYSSPNPDDYVKNLFNELFNH